MSGTRPREIRLKTVSRKPIPVTLTNSEDEKDTFSFEIVPSSALSARERKVLRDYVQALIEFDGIPDDELTDHDYYNAEEMMIEAIEIGTKGLDIRKFKALSYIDKMLIISNGLVLAFESEAQAGQDLQQQAARLQRQDEEERPNLFRRITAGMKSSSSQQPLQRVPTADESQTG